MPVKIKTSLEGKFSGWWNADGTYHVSVFYDAYCQNCGRKVERGVKGMGFYEHDTDWEYCRSSTGCKTNLRMPNSVGVIDSNYRGEVKAMYELAGISRVNGSLAMETYPHTIYKGDRICQMLFVKDPEVRLVQVDELSDSDRGTGGFGSTGV